MSSRRGGAQLLRALPVDVEQDVLASGQGALDSGLGRAVGVAVDARMLEQLAAGRHPVEAGLVDEQVVDAVGLAGALRAGGDRDRQLQLRLQLQDPARERGLAGTGGRGHDQHQAAAPLGVGHHLVEHGRPVSRKGG